MTVPWNSKQEAKEFLQGSMGNSEALKKMLLVLYGFQTQDEQAFGAVTQHNGAGFNGTDAEFLTEMAQKVLKGVPFKASEFRITKAKMQKYWNQLRKYYEGREL